MPGKDPAFRYPETNVFYRRLTRTYPRIVRGEGCYLYDDSGKRYLDACGGAFVASLGHGAADIAQAMAEQAGRVAYVNGTAFTSDPAELLAAELAELAPPGLDKSYFLCSGSEAVEAALKLARQYWVETGRPDKHKILSLSPGYHGNTLLALSASAREHYKTYYRQWLVEVARVPAPYAYRCPCRGEDRDCPACSGSALEEAILKEGPESVAAFIAEPVGGSSTGASVPRPDYFKRVREICDRHSVLFISDEVLAGCGRTGTWSALEPFGVSPDILVLGKGISGGYAPLSALCAGRNLLDPIAKGSGGLLHAQTFSHNPVSCAAGLAAVRRIRKDGLVERSSLMGKALQKGLRALIGRPGVGEVRGRGLLAGIELVQDAGSRRPFARRLKVSEAFVESAQRRGLVVWPNVGSADGVDGDLIMLAPPFIVTQEQIADIVRLVGETLDETIGAIKARI